MKRAGILFWGILLWTSQALGNVQPVVSNVVAVQRLHTALVDVTFDVADADGDPLYITLWYSLDGGVSWDNECSTVSGDVGAGIAPGTGHAATWDAGADLADIQVPQFMIRVYADDGGAGVLWGESFEQPCPGARTLSGDWECGTPTTGPGAAHDGVNCLATRLDSNYSSGVAWGTSVADSPPIDLSAASAPQLVFWGWVLTEGGPYDGFNLKISTNGGATFGLVDAVNPPYTLVVDSQPAWGGDMTGSGWLEFSADLGDYAGQAVILRLDFRSDASIAYPGVYVDGFVISD